MPLATAITLFLLASTVAAGTIATTSARISAGQTPLYLTSNDEPAVDPYVIRSSRHLLTDIDPIAAGGRVRAVIEMPTGTVQKWEVDKVDGNLRWEWKKGKPRSVQYLGSPGNYGMIPRTLMSKTRGGDGDPLDVLILGPALPRGSVAEVKIIGVLSLIDKGKADDKLIAVAKDDIFAIANNINTLDKHFPGVTEIIAMWFSHYKGAEKINVQGYLGPERAKRILMQALADYAAAKN